MSDAKSPSLGGLVDIDKGIVSRKIFVNDEIYRQELEQVFARAWLFVIVGNITPVHRHGRRLPWHSYVRRLVAQGQIPHASAVRRV